MARAVTNLIWKIVQPFRLEGGYITSSVYHKGRAGFTHLMIEIHEDLLELFLPVKALASGKHQYS